MDPAHPPAAPPTAAPSSAAAPPAGRRRLLLGLGLLILLAVAALTADVLRQRAHTEAVAWAGPGALANPDPRPTLIRFTADWCPPCQAMKREVFSRASLADTIARGFRAVSVDLTAPGPEAQRLALRHGAAEIPTFVILAPDGREAARRVGYADAAAFTTFLGRASAGPATSRRGHAATAPPPHPGAHP